MLRAAVAAFFLAAAPALWAQAGGATPPSPQEEIARLKRMILEKVRARLEEEHKRILEKIAKVIDEELAGKAPPPPPDAETDKKIAELEKKLAEMDEQRAKLRGEIEALRRKGAGVKDDEESIKAEAKEKGPQTPEEANELFQEAIEELNARDFEPSIRKFKWIFYQFPDNNLGCTAAYNVACGYSLKNERAKACDWLAISFKHGFAKFDHVRTDTDLDNIREEKRYKELMADK